MKRTVRSLNPSRISRISRTSRTFRQRKTVSPAERIPAPASQEAGVTEQSQDVSTTQNTETGGTQGTQGESTTQKPDTAAIQETQSAAPQEVHQDDNDNGSNGSGISDDGEPWQTVDADPGTLKINHNTFLFYNFSLFLI
jgi:hypothetical protein